MMSLRQRLLSGGKAYGPIIMSDSPVIVEMLSMVGYDHIVIDHEHSPAGLHNQYELLRALNAAQTKTEPIIRLPTCDTVYMKQVLDSMQLPGGVLVPMVDDAETARKVVESTKYPLQVIDKDDDTIPGVRGCAIPFIRATKWGMSHSIPEYMEQCQNDLLVMVQVETQRGINAIEEIASVEGIDGIFLGPFDISCSLGKVGQIQDEEVASAIRHAEQAIVESPCFLAGFQPANIKLKEMYDTGYSFVCGSIDLGLLQAAAKRDIAAAKKAMTKTAPQ